MCANGRRGVVVMETIRPESLALTLREVHYLLDQGIRAVQAREGLVVDGIVGPKTRAALDLLMKPAPPLLGGKGMFVRSVKHVGTVAAMLARAEEVGLQWLAFQAIWQWKSKKSTLYSGQAAHAKALRAAGRDVWVWGYPCPGATKEDEFVEVMLGSAAALQARGLIIDAEEPFLGEAVAAARLVAKLVPKAHAAGLCVGLSSYGAPWNFGNFPWAAFTGVDFASPQIYDIDNDLGETYPHDSVAAYKAHGYTRIVPACPTFSKTSKQLTALLAEVPASQGAIVWWDWYNSTQNPFTWKQLQKYKFPG